MRYAAITTALAAAALCALPATAAGSHGVYGCFPVDRVGTDAPEELAATDDAPRIVGFGGDDRLIGRAAFDCLSGGGGNDVLEHGDGDDAGFGRGGHDRIDGGAGGDALFGGGGADTLVGGDGDDLLHDENGDVHRDVLLGGAGDDRIEADNGARDDVDCGDGADVAQLDPLDVHTGCETIARSSDRVSVAPGAGTRRTRFAIRYTGDYDVRRECNDQAGDANCQGEGSATAKLVSRPSRRGGCRATGWITDDLSSFEARRVVRLRWPARGKAPCPGTYRFRLTYASLATKVDCDRLADRPVLLPGQPNPYREVPYQACEATEHIGEVVLRIRR